VKGLPGEFELIERLCAGLKFSRRVLLGPGDDCAILAGSRRPQLVKVDSMVEGVHFRIEWGYARLLGERAVTVNLSDIAAMGGHPTACVVNLSLRDGLSISFIDELYAGLRSAARRAGVDVVGGNITRAREVALTIAMLGELRGAALRRDAARAGDEIFVTGTLGDAAAGWRVLDGRLRARGRVREFLIGRCLSPIARLRAGQRLARMRPTPAAIDISDGLLQDLGHIVERSRVGAEIDADAIPVSRAYRSATRGDLSLALGGGEDYELLFCLRPGHSEAELTRRLGIQVSRIGTIRAGRAAVSIRGRRGDLKSLTPTRGWDQLRMRG
jgi:thiamine-monophosphate kinase